MALLLFSIVIKILCIFLIVIIIQNLTDQNTNISLYNSFGQLVDQINGQLDSDITFSNLQTGIYFIQINDLEVKKAIIL